MLNLTIQRIEAYVPHVTVDCCTKDRYLTTLPLTLISIANQTRKPDFVMVYDDSSNPIDIGANETLRYCFQLFDSKGIRWRHVWGQKRGQHIGHQFIQSQSEEYVWRIDDDEVAEPDVLQKLMSQFDPAGKIGAVGGLVVIPGAGLDFCKPNKIADAMQNKSYNCQWHFWKGAEKIVQVEHLYSSYVYRKGLMDYETSLSPVAHREETLHSYGIFKKGYRLIVMGDATTWHLRASTGGIRTGQQSDWERDEIAFHEIMREYDGEVVCFLDSGKGDHLVFKTAVLPKIREKYKKVTLAVCWPDIFPEEKCISLTEGAKICSPERHNISKWMIDHDWKDELKYAYAGLYGVEI
jgi:Glycosyl transferase family 2